MAIWGVADYLNEAKRQVERSIVELLNNKVTSLPFNSHETIHLC